MEDDVLVLENQAMERWRNGDPMGFVEQSAEDILYVDPGLTKPIIGIEAYRSSMQRAVGLIHYDKSEFISPKVVSLGDARLLTYNYRSSQVDSTGIILSQTPWNCTEVYQRQGEEWKIVHTHWSYIQHKMSDFAEIPIPVRSKPVEYDGVLDELMSLEHKAMERWRKGDPWGFLELYTPEMTYFDTGTEQRVNGRDAIRERYRQVEGQIFYEVMDFIEPWLYLLGDVAVLFYRFLSTRLNPDGSVKSRTPWNCTVVYERIEGHWMIIHNHWSLIRGERY